MKVKSKQVLCQDCLNVEDYTDEKHDGDVLCSCGGDFCGCDFCVSQIEVMNDE